MSLPGHTSTDATSSTTGSAQFSFGVTIPDLYLPDVTTRFKRHFGGGRWLDLIEIEYTHPVTATDAFASRVGSAVATEYRTRDYEVCYRCHNKSIQGPEVPLAEEQVEASDIIAMVTHPDQSPHIVLVVQFRPATGQYTIEWPSGLIDQKEGVGEAALRELKEETGYVGQVVSISPPMTNEPGMSSSRCCIVEVDVDGTLPENQKLQSQREEDEWSLQTITLPLDNLLEGLLELSKHYQPKLTVDARLYNYAAGLAAGRRSIRRS